MQVEAARTILVRLYVTNKSTLLNESEAYRLQTENVPPALWSAVHSGPAHHMTMSQQMTTSMVSGYK